MSDKRLDAQLVEATKEGDHKAFDILVKRYEVRVSKIVMRLVKDHHESLDICQEIFLKIYKALHNFRGESSFYTWLYRIAINTSKNYMVLKEHTLPHMNFDDSEIDYFLDKQMQREQATPLNFLIRDEVEKTIYDTINALPADLKKAIVLRELEGKSYEDIALLMSCPIGTVRSRIFRARTAIGKQVQSLL